MTAGKPAIPTEAEANAMGFTVTRNSQRWWDICSQRSRPLVAVRYRHGGKYAEVWSDAITAEPLWSCLGDKDSPYGWHQHQERLIDLMRLAADRTRQAGYRLEICYSSIDVSTCLASDAAPLAAVLIQVWDGTTTGLERLCAIWSHKLQDSARHDPDTTASPDR